MTDKILVIDGMALLFRHFYATSFRNQFMYNNRDVPTNGIQGMIRHSLKLIETVQPSNVVIAWDMGKETIRNEWFKNYKSNRAEPPEELRPQFDYVKEIIHDMGIYQIGLTGYEADDIIGTLSSNYEDLVIVSGDRDLLQLLNDSNDIWLTKKGFSEYNYYNRNIFADEYGITPAQFIDVKALMGDAGDGYYGVRGIGEKTALKLIKTYGNVNNILYSLEDLAPGTRNKIEADRESLHMSRKLAEIITDVPISHEEYQVNSPFVPDFDKFDNALSLHDLRISQKYLHTLDLKR